MLRVLSVISIAFLVVLTPFLLQAQDNSPKAGVLTGDKVRVRTGPDTKHKILLELRKGTKVAVIGKKDGWYQIEMPREVILWISKNYIKEVREGGALMGEVTGEKVNVRTGIEREDVVVGQVNKGNKVRIVGTKNGWYKIRPPKGFTAYMSAKFVKLEGGTAVEPTDPPKGNGQEDKYERRLRQLKEQIEALDKERKELERLLFEKKQKEKELEEKLRKAEKIRADYEREKKEIEEKYQRILKILKAGTKPKPKYTAEGNVDDFGKLLNPPPATHRLYVTPGSEPRYYLKSADASINLDNYLRKRVGVVGEIVKEKWGDKEIEVIKVIRIDILED